MEAQHPLQTPVVSISPSGDVVEGTLVTLTCSSRSDLPVLSYSWFKTGRLTALLQWSTYSITIYPITSTYSGEYYCQTTSVCGHQRSAPVSLQVVYAPQNTTVLCSESGVIVKGTSVTLTCSSDANPPVENYTWFKVNESTPVGSGQQYSITNVRSEDGGQYYCEARNKYGAENSTAVSITVTGGQSSVSTAVITVSVSVCGAVGLFCLVFFMSKKCKKNATQTREDRNTRDYVNVAQGGPCDSTQPDAVYQSLNPNTTQPDAVYQSLNPNTTQPDAVYQTLNTNTT
ncbi:B-cell receptor CD22-like [Alosa pseudoharengus]|uniref:B-cell receptor CD22-like n=1 Tax=Alosa pseudoharengus TaxID=34774 RepID=UPI003F8BA773